MSLISIFHKSLPIEKLVEEAQQGSVRTREDLIKKYTPFIISVISGYLNRFVSEKNDEEVIIGMEAFNEAIDSYNISKGQSFIALARIIIKRRLIDYLRKQENQKYEISLGEFEREDAEGNSYNGADNIAAATYYINSQQNIERKQDIELFKEILKEYKISLDELVKVSPKHKDARKSAIDVARLISQQEDLKRYLIEKKLLPLVELEKRINISRKTVERQRKYIIAITLILINDLSYLKEYLKEY